MTFAEELSVAGRGEFGRAAKRLNYAISGFKSMVKKTARNSEVLVALSPEEIHDGFIAIDKHWGRFRVLVRDQERFIALYRLLPALVSRPEARRDPRHRRCFG